MPVKQYRQKGNENSLTLEGVEYTGTPKNLEEMKEFIWNRYFQITDHFLIVNWSVPEVETKAPLGSVLLRNSQGEYVAVDKNLIEEV